MRELRHQKTAEGKAKLGLLKAQTKKEKKTSEERIKAMRTKHTKFAESEEKAFWQWV